MMGQSYINTQQNVESAATAQDEAEGKAVWDKLQSKQTDCKSLTDDDYDVLGDYFMGLMHGDNHALMNDNMTRMMGEDGEKAMHISMGKRMSGCDTTAAFPVQFEQFSSMMPMMGGSMMSGPMMGDQKSQNLGMMRGDFNYQYSPFDHNMMGKNVPHEMIIVCLITLVLVWGVLILTCAALIHYIKSSKGK